MKETPILFSTPMVQAILAGRKTMTRRVIKPQPDDVTDYGDRIVWTPDVTKCPYGDAGDRIWVRETHKIRFNKATNKYQAMYKCGPIRNVSPDKISPATLQKLSGLDPTKWRPSIFLFKEFSRILLKIKNIRVERLQDISEQDAKSEGVELAFRGFTNIIQHGAEPLYPYKYRFIDLWVSINGKQSWDANPYVWVIEF